VIILLCLLLEGFFSGSEIAVVSVDRLRLKHILKKRISGAKTLKDLKEKPDWFLTTTLIGTNLSTVTGTTIATYLVIRYFGAKYDYFTILMMSPLILIFAEILPKTIFQQRAGDIAVKISRPLKLAMTMMYPLVYMASKVSSLISYVLGKEEKEKDLFVSKDELELLLKMSDAKRGGVKITQKRMIHRIFDFTVTMAKEAMIPGVRVKALEINEPIEEAMEKLKEWKHSRVPVYKDRFDNIIGIIHSFDFIVPPVRKDLAAYIRPVNYFSEFTPLDDIMIRLQRDGEHMAAVVDEYGAVVGVITLEDIIEEVVGEIEDEYDNTKKPYRKISDSEFIIDASMELDAVSDELGIDLPKGDYETVAGFILDTLKKIPKKGEICKYKNIKIEITKVTARAIMEIRLFIEKTE